MNITIALNSNTDKYDRKIYNDTFPDNAALTFEISNVIETLENEVNETHRKIKKFGIIFYTFLLLLIISQIIIVIVGNLSLFG